MSNARPLDDMTLYKEAIIKKISKSQNVIGLLLNNPKIDMDSDEANDIIDRNIFDYDYIDRTVQRSDAYIMVDSELDFPSSGSMNQWRVYVQIVCAKTFNSMDHKIFRGVSGNRRDNLAQEIDAILNGERFIGIGELELISAAPANVPDTFTSMLLTYRVHDFRRERIPRAGR